jgi:hypothetical protein
MATLKVRDAAKDRGHFRLFGTLAIGHKVNALVLNECSAGPLLAI